MEQVEVVVHREVTDDEVVWWAESEAVPGFSAAASTLERLRKDIGDTLADVVGPYVAVSERLAD